MAQENTVIFNKQKQGVELQMLVKKEHGNRITFTTSMKRNNITTILQEDTSTNILLSDPNKYQFFNIFDFLIERNQLFIFYNDFGQIFMDKYILNKDSIERKERLFIGKHKMMSYENGGDLVASLTEKWIANDLYFNIKVKQMFGHTLNELYVFKQDRINRIIFSESNKLLILKPLEIRKDAIEWYKSNEDLINKTNEDINRQNLLSKFYNRPFEYFELTPNDKIYSQEDAYLWNSGLKDHIPFKMNEQKQLNAEQQRIILGDIRYLLSQYENIVIDNITLDGYIVCDSFKERDIFGENANIIQDFSRLYDTGDMINFFVKINQFQLYIIRYKINTNNWILSDFREEKVI